MNKQEIDLHVGLSGEVTKARIYTNSVGAFVMIDQTFNNVVNSVCLTSEDVATINKRMEDGK